MRLPPFIQENRVTILNKWNCIVARSHTLECDVKLPATKKQYRAKILDFVTRTIDPTLDFPNSEAKSGYNFHSMKDKTESMNSVSSMMSGINIVDLVLEFHAFRESVIEIWSKNAIYISSRCFEEIILFDNAVDQCLSEVVKNYSSNQEQPSKQLASIFSSISDQAFLVDANGKFTFVNKAVTQLNSMPIEDLIGKGFSELRYTQAQELQDAILHVINTHEQIRIETYLFTSTGKTTFDFLLMPVSDEEGHVDAVAVIARDVTERKNAEEKCWRHANFDFLTGLPNRRMFLDKLSNDIKLFNRQPIPFVLLFFDLDNFKEVNDIFGHARGDRLLQQVSERLLHTIRDSDTLARLGGDEFAIILRNLKNLSSAEVIANKTIAQIGKPILVDGHQFSISCSIGLASFPKDGLTSEALLEHADQAMYKAKASGGNKAQSFDAKL